MQTKPAVIVLVPGFRAVSCDIIGIIARLTAELDSDKI